MDYTICEGCGKSDLKACDAFWTTDGSSFCPVGCAPVDKGAEIRRLTQELEASRQREAEARDKALEEVIARFNALAREDLDRAERLEESDPEMATICRDFAGGLVRAYAEVRALKAPAIGSQGTEKGRG